MIFKAPQTCKKDPLAFLKKAKDIVFSPKLDGVRTIAVSKYNKNDAGIFTMVGSVEYLSRNGKLFPNFDKFTHGICHIAFKYLQAIECAAHLHQNTIYVCVDGEVVSKDNSFKSTMTQVRRLNSANPDIFHFHVFDIFMCDAVGRVISNFKECKFINRYNSLHDIFNSNHYTDMSLVEHEFLYDDVTVELLQSLTNSHLKMGYEGCVFKDCNEVYQLKKHVSWLKMKGEETCDFKVVGTVVGDGKYSVVEREKVLYSALKDFCAMPTYENWTIINKRPVIYSSSLDYYFKFEKLYGLTLESNYESIFNLIKPRIPKMLGALEVLSSVGIITNVGSGYTDQERVELLDCIPNIIEVKYQEREESGRLRFPVFVRVRDDKDEID